MEKYKLGDTLFRSIAGTRGELPNLEPDFFVEEVKCDEIRIGEHGEIYRFGKKWIHGRTVEWESKCHMLFGGLFKSKEEALKDAKFRAFSLVRFELENKISELEEDLEEIEDQKKEKEKEILLSKKNLKKFLANLKQ